MIHFEKLLFLEEVTFKAPIPAQGLQHCDWSKVSFLVTHLTIVVKLALADICVAVFRIFGVSEYLELRREHIEGTTFEERKA